MSRRLTLDIDRIDVYQFLTTVSVVFPTMAIGALLGLSKDGIGVALLLATGVGVLVGYVIASRIYDVEELFFPERDVTASRASLIGWTFVLTLTIGGWAVGLIADWSKDAMSGAFFLGFIVSAAVGGSLEMRYRDRHKVDPPRHA